MSEKLKKHSEAPIAEASEAENKYRRALADYHNLLKQTAREKEEFSKYANEGLLMDLIPVYDHLKMSLAYTPQSDKWLEGVKHVLGQFKKVLAEAGVTEIATVGQAFDHNTMEAVKNEDTDKPEQDGHVAAELKAGYSLNGKVIIPARVEVYKVKPVDQPQGGILLIMLLLGATIIAIIFFAKSGVYDRLVGTKQEPATVKLQLNNLQDEVNNYNKNLNNQIKE